MTNNSHFPAPNEKLDDHPIAQIFPMMNDTDRKPLTDSIRKNGLREAIVILDGKILDGRNRWQSCIEANVEPRFELYDYRRHGQSPTEYVMDSNMRRRHLTQSQAAAVAALSLPFYEAEAKLRQSKAGKKHVTNIVEPTPPPAVTTQIQWTKDETHQGEAIVEKQEHPEEKGADEKGSTTPTPAPTPEKPKRKPATNPDGTPKQRAPRKKSTPPGKAAEHAATAAGVSTSMVEKAAKLQREDPDAFKQVQAGTTTVSAALSHVSEAKAKEQQRATELSDAYQRIENICGKSLADAAREGTRLKGRKEVMAFAALTDDEMLRCRALIDAGWKVAQAVGYEVKAIAKTHRISALLDRAAASGGTFTLEVEGWRISCERMAAK